MQDRLKFRVYHKPTNKIYNVYGFNDDFVFIDTLDTCEPLKREDCILLQSTGLKDKNDKLIYEGDIIEDDNTKSDRGVVFFDKYSARFMVKMYKYNQKVLIKKNVRVVGNIRENKDLLENEDE